MGLKSFFLCLIFCGRKQKKHVFDENPTNDEGVGTIAPITPDSTKLVLRQLDKEKENREQPAFITRGPTRSTKELDKRTRSATLDALPVSLPGNDTRSTPTTNGPTPIRAKHHLRRTFSAPPRIRCDIPNEGIELHNFLPPFQGPLVTASAANQWQQRPETICECCLQTMLWLELVSLFDENNISLQKRSGKAFKRMSKEKGNVFGVSLGALVRRDQQATGEDTIFIPRVLQAILAELTVRGVAEEGILRVPGNKQKIDALYHAMEQHFYTVPEAVGSLLKEAGVHELGALLKRWLRELPQPLLTIELVHLFYQTNALPPQDQRRALAFLCQLLPRENRYALRAMLTFFRGVVEKQDENRMTLQNVATIMAPSFFPPTIVHLPDEEKDDIGAQLRLVAQCCQLTTVLLSITDSV